MHISLQFGVITACLVLLCFVLRLVLKDSLQLKYSLLWIVLALVLLVCGLFPQPLYFISSLFGFQTPANFVFVLGFLFLICIVLSMACLSSKQSSAIANLTQRIALLEKELESKNREYCHVLGKRSYICIVRIRRVSVLV